MALDTSKKNFIRIRGANVNNLKNLSVDIPRDKFVVFTGLSGSGKSSLVHLIPRFYDATKGEVRFHGVNVKDNKLDFDITGYVPNKSDKSECNQKNQILNISDGKSTILPKLLIDNYDVSSSHSAYIGKFRDEVLFYLMSRGISKEKATHLLIEGLLISGGDLEQEEVIKFQTEIENI